MFQHKSGFWVRALLLASVFGATASQAMAQASAAKSDGIEEVVVTAQKRAQNLQDVGIAVTALGADALASIGHQDITALTTFVPSVQVNQYSPTITVFNIRGVSQNDFSDSQEAPIAFYNDEVYVSALGAISGQNFDLQRIEVLRGPQGTLFGRNATGGLIQIITKKPTDYLDGYASLTFGSYGQIASEAAIGGPLSDTVRGRLSFASDNHDGYIKNLTGKNAGGERFYAVRGQLEADLSPRDTLLIKLQGLRNDHSTSGGEYTHVSAGYNSDGLGYALAPTENFWGTCPGCDAFGYKSPSSSPYVVSYDRNGFFDRTYWSATARYQHEFNNMQLVSITDYQHLMKRYGEDTDMSPLPIFNYDTYQKLHQFSQEVRLSGDSEKLNWVVGAYGLVIGTDNAYQVDARPILGFIENYGGKQDTSSAAVFGQGEYHFTKTLSFTLGGRYSWDWKSYNFRHAENGATDFVFNKATYPTLADKTFKNYSGKVELQYKPNKNALYYASISRGTKSGGFGVIAFGPFDPAKLPYNQEVLTNYEGGFKLTLANNRMTLNGDIFHYNYHNYQAFSIVGLSQYITNHEARVNGAELEVTAVPVEGVQLTGFASYLDTVVHGIVLPFGRTTDRKMPQAPAWSVGASAQYSFPLSSGVMTLQTHWKYNTSQYFSTFNSPIDYEPAYAVGNVRLSFQPNSGKWQAAFFVNNVTDKAYRLYDLDLGNALGLANQTYARPRWFGGTLTYYLQ